MSQADLRVLLIIKGLDIGGRSGGSEHFGLRLARELRKMDLNVSLCAYYRFDTPVEAKWVQQLEQEGIHCFFAAGADHLGLWAGIKTITRFVQNTNIRLIHSHFQAGTIASLAVKASVKGMRLLRTAHTPVEFGATLAGHVSRLLFVQLLYPLLLDAEAGVSRALVGALDRRPLARLRGLKAHLIYNGIDEPDAQQAEAPAGEPFSLREKSGAWLITSIGILNQLKQFDTIIEAMPSILKRIPQAHYVVVGSGPEESRLRALASQLEVADHVWFLGQRADVPSILRHSDIFVLPSRIEAMSTVILEAIQNGTPLIASNIPGNAELIEDRVDGLLFPVGDVEALAGCIDQAYQSPERMANYARHASAKLSRFSLQESASRYIQLYRELIAKAR